MMMRYIPHTANDVEVMLNTIGVSTVEDLFSPIAKKFRLKQELPLPKTMSEQDLRKHLESIADQNSAHHYKQFLGAGCYAHYIPSVVNYLASQGGFLTSYTPYQPEISQGTLQTTFEFQTMIARLTGMEIANASMYDGATSLAEACLMSKRMQPKKKTILLASNVHPEYRAVCKTYLATQEVELIDVAFDKKTGAIDLDDLKKKIANDTLAVITQSPNFFGAIEPLAEIGKISATAQAHFIVAVTEPLSLALLQNPGHFGADMVVGEAQSFGNSPSFGGPHVGFFATKKKYARAIPGRIVGATVDKDGERCYSLTLSTREQHIRRERATSNICTNEALLATRATIYLSTLGEQGLSKLANRNHTLANELVQRMKGKASLKFSSPYFNELVIETKKPLLDVQKTMESKKILGGVGVSKWYPELNNTFLVCTTELHNENDIDEWVSCL